MLDISEADHCQGTAIGGKCSAKKNLTQETLIAGSLLIVPACGLLSTLSDSRHIEMKQYGFQMLLGLGFGLVFASLTLMINVENRPSNLGKFCLQL